MVRSSRLVVMLGVSAALLGGCAKAIQPPAGPSFAEVERLLYPYNAINTADGHRRLGDLIRSTRSMEVRAASCYHYLRTSLDLAALTFYPIAAADGRPDRLLPIAQLVKRMPLEVDVARVCSDTARSIPSSSAWSEHWEELAQLVDTLSKGRNGGDEKVYHSALKRLAASGGSMGLRARFHLVGGCLASFFQSFRMENGDRWAAFSAGCGYTDVTGAAPPALRPGLRARTMQAVFDTMASDLNRSLSSSPADPFTAFVRHQLATVMAVRTRISTDDHVGQLASLPGEKRAAVDRPRTLH